MMVWSRSRLAGLETGAWFRANTRDWIASSFGQYSGCRCVQIMYYHSGHRDITVLEVAPRRAVSSIVG